MNIWKISLVFLSSNPAFFVTSAVAWQLNFIYKLKKCSSFWGTSSPRPPARASPPGSHWGLLFPGPSHPLKGASKRFAFASKSQKNRWRLRQSPRLHWETSVPQTPCYSLSPISTYFQRSWLELEYIVLCNLPINMTWCETLSICPLYQILHMSLSVYSILEANLMFLPIKGYIKTLWICLKITKNCWRLGRSPRPRWETSVPQTPGFAPFTKS